jgi:hypothetical protein
VIFPKRVMCTRIDQLDMAYFLSSYKLSWRQRLRWSIRAHELNSSANFCCGTSR